jgi:ubiquitin C-terminal hydrolase
MKFQRMRPWLKTQAVSRNYTPHTPSTIDVSKEYSYTPYFSPLCLHGTLKGGHYLSATRNLPRGTEKTRQDIHKITGTPNVAKVNISFLKYICPSIRLTANLSARKE